MGELRRLSAADRRAHASECYTTSIPKPVIDHLGKGMGIEVITYAIKGVKVEVKTP